MAGRRVCSVHGGLSPRPGLSHPSTKHGLYSKDLPTRYAANYEALLALGDHLFSVADETAAITALTQDALSRIEAGESGAAWGRLAELHRQMEAISRQATQSEQDAADYAASFEELGQIIRRGALAYTARDEAVKLMEQKRRFVGDERKIQVEQHKAMTFDRVMLLITAIVAGLKQALDQHADEGVRVKVLDACQKHLARVMEVNDEKHTG